MEITIEQLEGDIKLIRLTGRLDIAGTQAIDNQFNFATTTQTEKIIIDLSQVSFLASFGIRLLLSGARGQMNRSGRFALLNPQEMVRRTLELAGIPPVIPVFYSLDDALASLALN